MSSESFMHLFHILFVGVLFLYVGIYRDKIYYSLFNVLYYLGIIIIFYHIYKSYNYLKDGKSIWVNLIHILIIGPVLIIIGYNKEKTSRKFFEILLMLGFSAICYHLYYLFQ
jgi:hypothetical protein